MSVVAKLFMDGGDQAVDLPDECRFESIEVRISKVGDKVILQPLSSSARTEAEIAANWAEFDALRNGEKPFPELLPGYATPPACPSFQPYLSEQ
jgi:antitoxin VapB